jgi:flavodoxin
MVHWPEVMVSYEDNEKVLFSADAFGTFGNPESDKWLPEARRYYFNIVGKYGSPVQTLLKKAAALDIQTICPLHGPVLKENLSFYLEKYQTWSSYAPEEKGVLVAYGSLHGNTAGAAKYTAELLRAQGVEVFLIDLARDDMALALAEAFKYDKMVLACSTYDGNFFPKMEDFLLHLKAKAFQKRKVALIENGSWAPMAAKGMKAYLEQMKDITVCDGTVTIKSTVSEANKAQMAELVTELLALDCFVQAMNECLFIAFSFFRVSQFSGDNHAFCGRERDSDWRTRVLWHEHLPRLHPWLHLLRQPQQLLPVHPLFRGYRGEAERTGAPGSRPSIQAEEDHGRYRVHVRPLYALRGKPGTDPTMS